MKNGIWLKTFNIHFYNLCDAIMEKRTNFLNSKRRVR